MALEDYSRTSFEQSVETLATLPAKPLAANFAVAIAALAHRRLAGDEGLSTTALQREVCDPSWAKEADFLPAAAEGHIYKPFTRSFKDESANNWRNAFDLQGGIGCEAPNDARYLLSTGYLSEPRTLCDFRTDAGKCLLSAGSASCFDPAKHGDGLRVGVATSANSRPKILRRRSSTKRSDTRYWVLEPTVESLVGLIPSPAARVPARDFAIALIAGSSRWSDFDSTEPVDALRQILNLDDERFLAIFDAGGASLQTLDQQHQTALQAAISVLPSPIDYVTRDSEIVFHWAESAVNPENRQRLLESATRGHRLVLDCLAVQLVEWGCAIDEQLAGYDLRAVRADGGSTLFEVKTWTASNLPSQIRSAWAQLDEYAYRNRDLVGADVQKAIVLDREPPDFWAWEWFQERGGPHLLWRAGSTIEAASWSKGWWASMQSDAPAASV